MTLTDYLTTGGQMADKKLKRTHSVDKEHQELFDKIVDEVFDEEWHRETTQRHNDAYIVASNELKGKKFVERQEAEEALIDAIIKYRTESGIPVSTDPKHRHYIHQEVKSMLEQMVKDSEGKISIENMIKEGNTYKLLEKFHEYELNKNINGKLGYEIDKRLPHGKDPDFYQGLAKAYGNYIGRFYTKGQLARIGSRDSMASRFGELYGAEIQRRTEEYITPKKTETKKAGAHH